MYIYNNDSTTNDNTLYTYIYIYIYPTYPMYMLRKRARHAQRAQCTRDMSHLSRQGQLARCREGARDLAQDWHRPGASLRMVNPSISAVFRFRLWHRARSITFTAFRFAVLARTPFRRFRVPVRGPH